MNEMINGNQVETLKNTVEKLAYCSQIHNEILLDLATSISKIIEEKVTNEVSNKMNYEISTAKQEIEAKILSNIDDNIDNKVRYAVDDRGLNRIEISTLEKARKRKMFHLLGDSKSEEYTLLSRFYFGKLNRDFKKEFDCSTYGDVLPSRFMEAVNFIDSFTISPDYRAWAIRTLHKNYEDGEIESQKLINAYKRYFNIK